MSSTASASPERAAEARSEHEPDRGTERRIPCGSTAAADCGEAVGRAGRPGAHPRSIAASAALSPPITLDRCRVPAAAQPDVTGGEVAERDQRQERSRALLGPARVTSRTSAPAPRAMSSRQREPRRELADARGRSAARSRRAARPYGRTHPTTSLWSSSDIAACQAGTLPFSFSWVFQRIAATAPIPSAPQHHRDPVAQPGRRAPSPGCRRAGTSGASPAMQPADRGRASPRRRASSDGRAPPASSAPSIANVR